MWFLSFYDSLSDWCNLQYILEELIVQQIWKIIFSKFDITKSHKVCQSYAFECDKCRSSSVANMWTLVQVRLRCQKGIPPALRGRTWLYLSGGKVKKEQNQARFQVSQVSLSLLLSFFLPYFFGFWVPVHFQLSFYTTLGCLLTQNADVLNSAPDRTFSNDTHDSRMSFVCSARSWIISQGIPNGWMSSRKTCIDSFLFMKCSCHEEDTGRRLLCRALDFNGAF